MTLTAQKKCLEFIKIYVPSEPIQSVFFQLYLRIQIVLVKNGVHHMLRSMIVLVLVIVSQVGIVHLLFYPMLRNMIVLVLVIVSQVGTVHLLFYTMLRNMIVLVLVIVSQLGTVHFLFFFNEFSMTSEVNEGQIRSPFYLKI